MVSHITDMAIWREGNCAEIQAQVIARRLLDGAN